MPNMQLTPNQIKILLKENTKHPYIKRYNLDSAIDKTKILLLSEMSKYAVEDKFDDKRKIITTFMLVQIALDTHESIPNENHAIENHTDKQLSVLAGDFYSGLYYDILADIGRIDTIQTLAQAIKLINENKLKLFYLNTNDTFEHINLIVLIESCLLKTYAKYYDLGSSFIELIKIVNKYTLLQDILNAYKTEESNLLKYDLLSTMDHASQLNTINKIKEMNLEAQAVLRSTLEDMPFLAESFKLALTSQLDVAYSTSLVEEG